MKKVWLSSIVVLFLITVAACGTTKEKKTEKENETSQQTEEKTDESTVTEVALAEPDEKTVCEYCNMTVYPKDHDMGAFSAQGISEDGKNYFFDDIGCMLNQERQDDITLDKYVRDYNTDEWVKLEDAVMVKAEIKTPMNYGYAFFKDEEGAQGFIDEQGADKASLASLDEIDEEASHRHMKKMEKMENGENMDMDHGDGESMDMNNEDGESMDMNKDDSHS
ncbi:nitrous oxide reductase accessory protein NosL [Rossellomorea vietnamensis]|uniref:nitrous oxide reductase accessory protein NosL n=1 Tax=Rossellomorea vietnamensis TaxID=218284 RepID=UPI001E33138C|nr:nitrous oxide reductase accessory protein NosL [Rossellomorea vietnamensis]MCC5803599.1 nitrous oxide reductase accessory protein NosL [Rossellomorea vietnamensis]